MRNSLFYLVFLCLAPITAGTSAEVIERIVAVVDDGVVLESELDRQVTLIRRQLGATGTPLPPEDILREQVLERLILKELQLQLAERRNVRISDEQLNATLDGMARSQGISLSQLPQLLEQDGISYPLFREDMRDELTINQLQQLALARRIQVSPREVDQLLAVMDNSDDNSEYKLSHILIAVQAAATTEEVAAAREKAESLRTRIQAGEDFAQLAVAYSDGQNALSGGSLGWRPASRLPTLFAEQVTGMSKSETSEPIRSSSGYHLIRIDDTRGSEEQVVEQQRARHILIVPDQITDDAAAEARLQVIRQRVLDGEDFAEIARVESDDVNSAVRGGDLDWASPNTFAPEFEEQLAGLSAGQMSEPFRSRFGWHLVRLMERRTRDVSDDVRRDEAMASIRARKIEEETQLWLRQMRDEAYVEVRTKT